MKINRIQLKNFKVFRDNTIEFSSSNDKNVTLVYGVNGAGKSCLFRAINWGLYGEPISEQQGNRPDINEQLKQELMEGQEAEMKVILDLSHENTKYTLERSVIYILKSGKLSCLKNSIKTLLSVATTSRRPDTYENEEVINKIIESLLPKSSKEYFLCDGEKIEELAKQKKGAIEGAIREVLSLEFLDNAVNNLNGAANDWRLLLKGTEGASAEWNQKNDLLTRYNKQLVVYDKRALEFKDIFNGKLQKYKEKKTEYEASKVEHDLIKNKLGLLEDQETNELSITNNRKDLRDKVTVSHNIYSKYIIYETKVLLERWHKEGKYPRKLYTPEFIQDIINNQQCFFWNFKEGKGGKEYKYFEQILEDISGWGDNISTLLMNLREQIHTIYSRGDSDFDLIKNDYGSYSKTLKERIKIQTELDDIQGKIHGEGTIEDIKKADNEFETARDGKIDAENDVENNQKDMDKLKGNIEILEKQLVVIGYKGKKGDIYTQRSELILKCRDWLKNLIKIYTLEKREEVETTMKKLFKVMMAENQEELQPPILNENYHLKVLYKGEHYDPSSKEGIENLLSSGQGQILILSFIAALAKTASEKAPFLMDTPLARISIEPTTAICKHLPEQVSQLILFVTDKELTREGEKYLYKRCEKIWTLTSKYKNGMRNLIIKEGKHVKSDYSKIDKNEKE